MDLYVPFFKYPEVKELNHIKNWKVVNPNRRIKTGDIFLFSGSAIASSIIKLFTRSKWCHVGMACWCEIELNDGKKQIDLYCFELGSQPYTCLMTKQYTDMGVRLVRFADISEMYDMIALRKLNVKRGDDWCEKFTSFMTKWKSTPFFALHTLIKSYLIYPGAPENQTTCSQITAMMLHHMEVHKLNFDPSQLSPDDYAHYNETFPKHIFKGKERVIYVDNRLLRSRVLIVSITLIVILIILWTMFSNRKSKR